MKDFQWMDIKVLNIYKEIFYQKIENEDHEIEFLNWYTLGMSKLLIEKYKTSNMKELKM